MADKVTEPEVKVEVKETPNPNDKDVTLLGEQPEEVPEGLFDEEEDFDETQLTGEESEPESEEEAKAKTEAKEKEAAEAKAKEELEAKAGEEAKVAEEAKAKKEAEEKAVLEGKEEPADPKSSEAVIPEGFIASEVHENVKIALRQERGRARELAGHISTLETRITELEAVPLEKEDPEFEVLSDEDLNDLIEDDPEEANRYMAKLTLHERRTSAREAKEKEAKSVQDKRDYEEQSAIDDGVDLMIETVPGIFDESKSVAKDLTDFAEAEGVDVGVLSAITDPATLFLSPSSDKVSVLGKGAAQLVKLIANAHQKAVGVDPVKLKETITAEVEKELTAKVTKELLTKLKKNPNAFKDIAEVAGKGDAPEVHEGLLSESEIAKMSPDQEEAYLSGA